MHGEVLRRTGWRVAAAALIGILVCACTLSSSRPVSKYILYPARKGDTLSSIARRFDVSIEKLERVNRLSAGRQLSAGQTIKVPYHGQSLKRGPDDIAGGTTARKKAPAPQPASLRQVKLSKAARYVGKLAWPVGGDGGTLSSEFGWRWLSFHEGIDISAPEGLPVVAAHDGQVVYSGSGIQGYGNLVVVKADGLLSVYAHNRKNRVRAGQNVRRGERIADVGMTGKSTGPHLHFETRIKDQSGKNAAVDPLVFLKK